MVTNERPNRRAYIDYILRASQNPDTIKEHETETGKKKPSKLPDEALKAENGGVVSFSLLHKQQEAWIASFVSWATHKHWGIENAPEGWQQLFGVSDGKKE